MADKNIKDTILKLLTLAKDGGATEAEAAAAMTKAMALMAKYNVEVEAEGKAEESVFGPWLQKGWDKKWHIGVAAAVAELYNVRYLIDRQGGFQFIGRVSNVEAANETLPWLIDQVERLYKSALPKGMTKSARAEYRRTFKLACSNRVYARARDIAAQMQSDDKLALESTGCTALVLQTQAETLLKEAQALLETLPNLKYSVSRPSKAGRGTWDGYEAGNKVELNKKLEV